MRKLLFQNCCLSSLLSISALIILSVSGCKNKSELSPQDYELHLPHRIQLGKAMNEISGICFSEEDSSLLAVSDSKERVFEISLKSKKLKNYTDKVVDAGSDVEDVVKKDNTIFLLKSNGELVEVPLGKDDTTGVKTYSLGLAGANDFETVYYDPTAGGLVLICKTCVQEKGKGVSTTYRFDLRTRSFDSSAFFTISKAQIKKLLKRNDAQFDPSAAAIHPVSKRVFILSSAGNLLVITDNRGQVVEAYELNPNDFPQAEGIAFAPNGDMYIANEGKNGKPTLLRFTYGPNKRKQ